MYRCLALKMVVHYVVTAEVFLVLMFGSITFVDTRLRYVSPPSGGDPHPHSPHSLSYMA